MNTIIPAKTVNLITNIGGVVLVIVNTVTSCIQTGGAPTVQSLVASVVVGLIAYFTGKKSIS